MSEKLRHSYWIPTNRDCSSAIHSYVNEIHKHYIKTGEVIPVFILDSGNEKIENLNKKVISEISIKYPKLHFFHISYNTQKRVISQILKNAGLDMSWIDLFASNTVNYGAAMNRIYLLAAGLGFDVIHRRDSDTQLQLDCPYPLEHEVTYIGKKLDGRYNINRPVYVVGSGYVGEWNLDIKPFTQKEPALFYEFLTALNIPKESHDKFISSFQNEDEAENVEDQIQLVYKNETRTPEAGNFAIYELHKWLPCLPANYTIGADYFTFKMAIALGFPILCHERKVVHQYHQGRKEDKYLNNYIYSLAKLVDHSPVYWYYINHKVKPYLEDHEDQQLLNDEAWIKHLSEGMADNVEVVKKTRKNNLLHFANNFVSALYPDIGKDIANKVDLIIEECISDYIKHAKLLLNWRLLIHTAVDMKTQIIEEVNYES